jgi:hypothetical protein
MLPAAPPHTVIHSHACASVVEAVLERCRLQPQSTSTASVRQGRNASSCAITVGTRAMSARPSTTPAAKHQHRLCVPTLRCLEALYLIYFLNIFKSLQVQNFSEYIQVIASSKFYTSLI